MDVLFESLLLNFKECGEVFESRMNDHGMALTDALAEYCVHYSVDFPLVESTNETLGIKIKKIITSIITTISNYFNSIKVQVQTMTTTSKYKENLRKMHAELKEKKSGGAKKVKVQDIWSLRDVYLEGRSKLQKYAKKFAAMRYKTTEDLQRDIDEFNDLYNEYEQKAEAAIEKQVEVPIDKMLAFVEAECSGNGSVISSLESAMLEFREMGNSIITLSKKADILGPDILEKQVGFLKRQMLKITSFIKKWVVKFVVTMCIVIG